KTTATSCFVQGVSPFRPHSALLPRLYGRLFDDLDASIRPAFQDRRIESEHLAAPPHAGGALFRHGREPVLPKYRTHLPGWPSTKGVVCKKCKHILVIGEQPYLRPRHKGVILP